MDPKIWNGDIWTGPDEDEDNEPSNSGFSLSVGPALPHCQRSLTLICLRTFNGHP